MDARLENPGAARRPRRHVTRWVAVVVLVAAGALVAVLATRPPAASTEAATPLLDQQAPAVSGTTLSGQPFDLASLRGRWVLLNFFASWCPPCQQEQADLVSFDYEHQSSGVSVVGVAFDDAASSAKQFLARSGATWPAIADPSGQIALTYGVRGPPETFIISPSGIVLDHLIGPVTNAGLDNFLAQDERAAT